MTLSYRDIGEIISLIDSSSCDEFVLETDEVKLVLRRRGAGAPPPSGGTGGGPVQASAAQSAADTPAKASAPAAAAATPAKGAQANVPGVVSAPMVGTFYRAPSPDEPPFVEVGSNVEVGDPLCIIEVMKLMNSARAGVAGEVVEILGANGEMVEHGEALMLVRPD